MPIFSKQILYCPVCKTQLGERLKNELIMAHCEECKTTFIWKGKCKVPESSLDSAKKKGCGCESCKALGR